MKVVQSIENFFLKVETFFSNLNFIARLSTAASVGIKAFNDSLMKRNESVLKTYLDGRNEATGEDNEA